MLLAALRQAPPDAVALVDGYRTVTYGALPSLLQHELDWLRASGAERHALLASNGVPWALADLALHTGRMFSVPLPGSFTAAQVTHALDDAGIDAVLTDDDSLGATLLEGWRHD
ncbi:MAG: AMP-binding protein, partial [Gammaproteobacteria bacterium]|nr:AMP-binding protein [Gammaproteobacteria bacterium]